MLNLLMLPLYYNYILIEFSKRIETSAGLVGNQRCEVEIEQASIVSYILAFENEGSKFIIMYHVGHVCYRGLWEC